MGRGLFWPLIADENVKENRYTVPIDSVGISFLSDWTSNVLNYI